MFQEEISYVYEQRPNVALLFTILAALLLWGFSGTINRLFPKPKQLGRLERYVPRLVALLCVIVPTLAVRIPLERAGTFTNDYLAFAFMASGFFPLELFLLKVWTSSLSEKMAAKRAEALGWRPSEELENKRERFGLQLKLRRVPYLATIGIGWLAGLVNEFGVQPTVPPLESRLYVVPEFRLGFLWAGFAVLAGVLLTQLIQGFLPVDKKIPKSVLKNAEIAGSLWAFGIWSAQLFVLGLLIQPPYGPVVFNLPTHAAVTGIYFAFFALYLKKFMKLAVEESEKELLERLAKEKAAEEDREGRVKDRRVVLEVKDLVTRFFTEEGVVKAVEGVSFEIYEDEVLGLVGETGCGKSVTALSVVRLVRAPGKIMGGQVMFMGEDLLKKSEKEMLSYRGNNITMIFQDPLNSVNPVFKIGDQIAEVFLLHKHAELLAEVKEHRGSNVYGVARAWAAKILTDVGIPDAEQVLDRYPHELSGGMRQRVMIAMALGCSPKLLLADEPTTALDVTIQAQILELMKELKRKYHTSILLITHDLGIISEMCDRVAVMYSGNIVEYGEVVRVFKRSLHPYTQGLMAAIPRVGERSRRLAIIPGLVPNLIYPPPGCRFHPRCKYRFEPCDVEVPKLIEVESGYKVACHLYDPKHAETAAAARSRVESEKAGGITQEEEVD
ncbi:MAG: hypothetical protein Kow0069_09720 [Promethearchaeota archaeon]